MKEEAQKFDVIVVGGGHAGTEAALAGTRCGARVLLLTQSIDTLGQMSCNPAIGGIGKGHLVREIDALGGIMGRAADCCGIQYRTLNARKGPAVRATRAQIDRQLYKTYIRKVLEQTENLSLFQQSVDDLIIEDEEVKGVQTQMGLTFYAPTVVLTVGTFLGGIIHIGDRQYGGGRAGDAPSNALARTMRERKFPVERLKTGTPPRIDGKSVDFSNMVLQPGDEPIPTFSFVDSFVDASTRRPQQLACHITYTNARTHHIIREGLHRSAMYSGAIEGIGPRYCPSIEDKVVRFAERDKHQIFVEPEGLGVRELYPNGISTSLPYETQLEFVRSIEGFEHAHITRPGYAIEYDYFSPTDLFPTLESSRVNGLFLAGQINGTTGYEEAGAQGLIAGLNAARKSLGKETWSPGREQAYIGVMIDDLVTRGTNEPYRMFTSRAEYRLLLREDNADLRLTEQGRLLGLIDDERWSLFAIKREKIEVERQRLQALNVPLIKIQGVDEGASVVANGNQQIDNRVSKAWELLRRPQMKYRALMVAIGECYEEDEQVQSQLEIQAKYEGYVNRQQLEIERVKRYESLALDKKFNYSEVRGLSNEVREKLNLHKPISVGQASRISGVTPAAVSLLLVHLKKVQHQVAEQNLTELEMKDESTNNNTDGVGSNTGNAEQFPLGKAG